MIDFVNRLTGRDAEKKLAEYSEVYGEVLLGMHRDLEDYRRQIEDHKQQIGLLELALRRLHQLMIWGAGALALFVLSGVIAWIIHVR